MPRHDDVGVYGPSDYRVTAERFMPNIWGAGDNTFSAGHLGTTGWPLAPGATFSFVNATRTFTVTDGGGAYYLIRGVGYSLGGNHTVTITDTEGIWFIYFDGAVLTSSQTPWDISDDDSAMVSIMYWDATNNKEILLTWEPHGFDMPASVHHRLHHSGGAAWESGLAVTDAGGELLNVEEGEFDDEDLHIDITDGAGGDLFEQVLSPAELPVYYRDGATAWRIVETGDKGNPDDAGYVDGADDLIYNKLDGVWSTTSATNHKYVAYFVIASNDQTEPVALIMGQRVDNTLAAAKANNTYGGLDLTGMPFQEIIVLARVILKDTGDALFYTLEDLVDLRQPTGSSSATPLDRDHGALVGLGDDDHPTYIMHDGTRALTADWNVGAFDVTAVEVNATTKVVTPEIANAGGIAMDAADAGTSYLTMSNSGAGALEVLLQGTLLLRERAAAEGDLADYGQLWVKTGTPCELWFTDDEGTDTKIV